MSGRLLALIVALQLAAVAAEPTVGREGRIVVTLPVAGLHPVAPAKRPDLLLRIARETPVADGVEYDLRYQAQVAGELDLADFLRDPAGLTVAALPPVRVRIGSLLPADHQGGLDDLPSGPAPVLGGYLRLLLLIAIAWSALPLWWLGRWWLRRRRQPRTSGAPVADPAQRLADLVMAAQRGALDAGGLAELERRLIAHWRDRLELGALSPIAALAQLRADPEAGELLRAVEGWLHARPGTVVVDVGQLLAPYGRAGAGAA